MSCEVAWLRLSLSPAPSNVPTEGARAYDSHFKIPYFRWLHLAVAKGNYQGQWKYHQICKHYFNKYILAINMFDIYIYIFADPAHKLSQLAKVVVWFYNFLRKDPIFKDLQTVAKVLLQWLQHLTTKHTRLLYKEALAYMDHHQLNK